MTVHTLAEAYQTPGEKSHIKNWVNKTVGLRIDAVNQDDEGNTNSVTVTVFTAEGGNTGESSRIESARIIGQIASAGVAVGDVLIVTVVPYGKRGQVLAPPAPGDKDAKTIGDVFDA